MPEVDDADERARLKEELLATRDLAVGYEASLGEALGRVRELEAELVRYQAAVDRLELILGSGTWRTARMLHRLMALVTGRE